MSIRKAVREGQILKLKFNGQAWIYKCYTISEKVVSFTHCGRFRIIKFRLQALNFAKVFLIKKLKMIGKLTSEEIESLLCRLVMLMTKAIFIAQPRRAKSGNDA